MVRMLQCTGDVATWGRQGMHAEFWRENLLGNGHFEKGREDNIKVHLRK